MKVKDAMTEKVEEVSPETLRQEVARKIMSLDEGVLSVCDGERLVGTFTDRDITVCTAAEGKGPKTTDKRFRCLPVLSRDKQLVGVVSPGDLAVEGTGRKDTEAALKVVSQPAG